MKRTPRGIPTGTTKRVRPSSAAHRPTNERASLLRPSASDVTKTTKRALARGRTNLGKVASCLASPGRGAVNVGSASVSGTNVMSTTSWPKTISNRRLSQARGMARSKSLTIMIVVTRAPPRDRFTPLRSPACPTRQLQHTTHDDRQRRRHIDTLVQREGEGDGVGEEERPGTDEHQSG